MFGVSRPLDLSYFCTSNRVVYRLETCFGELYFGNYISYYDLDFQKSTKTSTNLLEISFSIDMLCLPTYTTNIVGIRNLLNRVL